MCFDGLDHFRQIETYPLRFHNELFHFLIQEPLPVRGTRRRQIGNHRADTGPGFEEAFLDEMLNHFVRSVGMDLEIGRECAHRRKWLARLECPADKCLLRRVDYLIEDRFSGP